jgi:glutamyl-tRNA reductase
MAASEMVILSTCNRVELYTAHEGPLPAPEAVAALLASRSGAPADRLVPALYQHRGPDAVRHLFRVASSLDSMVVGEAQILGQVKDAYMAAQEAGATGRIFNRLFQQALHVAKRVRATTSIGERNVSVPSVAARLAEKVFQDLSTKTMVLLGAGETGELTAAAFRNRGLTGVHVVNRTLENARDLASRFGGQAHGFDELARVLPLGDIVIACVASDSFVLSVQDVRSALEARRCEPMFLIDIAVPRNINPEANRIDNVYLFDIDDLESILQQNIIEREREAERCAPLIDEETRTFFREVAPPDVATLLEALREKLRQIGDEESQRTLAKLNGLSPGLREEIADLARRIVAQILQPSSDSIRHEALDGQSHRIIELTRKLFSIK